MDSTDKTRKTVPTATERVSALIDAASKKAGSTYKLAKMLGYSESNFSQWRHGLRSCPVVAQALMADVAQLDPVEVYLYASIEAEPNLKRKERLAEVLGKALGSTTAQVASFAMCASYVLVSNWPEVRDYLIRCILC